MTALLVRLFIKNHTQTDDPKVRTAYGLLGGILGCVCNLLLFGVKLLAGVLSGSVSIIADAFNNLSDIGSSVIAMLGMKLAGKPADPEHPFGHGRMEYMSAAVVSLLILLVGFELLKSSVTKIFNPEPVSASVAVWVILAASVAAKLWLFFANRFLGKKVASTALKATAQDCLSDSVATSAVLVSLLISVTTGVNIDPYMGVVVSCFVMYTGINTAKEALDPLLGTPADPETVRGLRDAVLEFEPFVAIHDLIIHNYGPGRRFASLHVEVPSDIDIVYCHELIDLCEKRLQERFGIEADIHMHPIVTDAARVNELKHAVIQKITEFDPKLHIHDFRVVEGENRTNLIFDLVVPPKYKLTEAALKAKVGEFAKAIDPTYVCVITIDLDFNAGGEK